MKTQIPATKTAEIDNFPRYITGNRERIHVEISQDDVIQELVDYAQYLNNRIEGDFNLAAVTSEMREYSFAFVRRIISPIDSTLPRYRNLNLN